MTASITNKRSREESGNESFFPAQKLPRTVETTTAFAQANLRSSSSSNSLDELAAMALRAEIHGGEIEESSTEQPTPLSMKSQQNGLNKIPKKEKRRYSCDTCNWSTVQPTRMHKHQITHKQNSDINISIPMTSSFKEGSKLPEIYRNQAPLTFTLPPINAASSKLSEEESELPENWDQAPLTFTMPQKNAASSKVGKERSKLPEIYRNQAPLTFALPPRKSISNSMVEDLQAICNKIAMSQAQEKIRK